MTRRPPRQPTEAEWSDAMSRARDNLRESGAEDPFALQLVATLLLIRAGLLRHRNLSVRKTACVALVAFLGVCFASGRADAGRRVYRVEYSRDPRDLA